MGILSEGNLPLPRLFHVLSQNGELLFWQNCGFCKYSCCLPLCYIYALGLAIFQMWKDKF